MNPSNGGFMTADPGFYELRVQCRVCGDMRFIKLSSHLRCPMCDQPYDYVLGVYPTGVKS